MHAFSMLLACPRSPPSLCCLLWERTLRGAISCQPQPDSGWEPRCLTRGSRALPGSEPGPAGAAGMAGPPTRGGPFPCSPLELAPLPFSWHSWARGSAFLFLSLGLACCCLCSCCRDSHGMEDSVFLWKMSLIIYPGAFAFSKI